MKLSSLVGKTITVVFLAGLISAHAHCQNIVATIGTLNQGFVHWDRSNQSIVVYTHQKTTPAEAVNVFDSAGTKSSVDILKDFPGAIEAWVSAVSAAPGGVVIASRLEYPQQERMKDLILSYDRNGKLTSIWDVEPYEPSVLYVDEGGFVYSCCMRIDESTNGYKYSIINKYDSNGNLVQAMVSRDLFPADIAEVDFDTNHQMRQSTMLVANGQIFLYLAGMSQRLVINSDGTVASTMNVADKLRRLTKQMGYDSFFVNSAEFSSDGNLWMQLVTRPKGGDTTGTVSRGLIVELTGAGDTNVRRNLKNSTSKERLIGVTSAGEEISATSDEKGNLVIIKH